MMHLLLTTVNDKTFQGERERTREKEREIEIKGEGETAGQKIDRKLVIQTHSTERER